MDEALTRKLVRQLRWLNFVVTFFGILFLAALVIAGILLYKAVSSLHKAEQSITSLQQNTSQTLNFQNQICSDTRLKALAGSTDLCK